MWRIRWANNIPTYIQQDVTLHSLFISGNCSTCFGWYFHPSSGAHTTVSTASGICHTVTATCRYRGRVGTGLSVLWVACTPYDRWKYHPKHEEQFPDINKLCNVASCWIHIGILLEARPILHISRITVKQMAQLYLYSPSPPLWSVLGWTYHHPGSRNGRPSLPRLLVHYGAAVNTDSWGCDVTLH
jgi:hypothetical protein